MKRFSKRRASFTLAEVMFVVAIGALLVAIAVPGCLRARKRSQASEKISNLVDSNREQESDRANAPQTIYNSTDITYLITESRRLYRSNDFSGCVAACERVLHFQPQNKIAFNNQCAALNQMKLYQEALKVAEAGLASDSSFQLLRNNQQEALAKAAIPIAPDIVANGYIELSLVYYRLGLYLRTVAYCQKTLSYTPNSSVAYNNICSAYNQMHDFDAAVAAGEKALNLDPASALIRANLDVARAGGNKHPP